MNGIVLHVLVTAEVEDTNHPASQPTLPQPTKALTDAQHDGVGHPHGEHSTPLGVRQRPVDQQGAHHAQRNKDLGQVVDAAAQVSGDNLAHIPERVNHEWPE